MRNYRLHIELLACLLLASLWILPACSRKKSSVSPIESTPDITLAESKETDKIGETDVTDVTDVIDRGDTTVGTSEPSETAEIEPDSVFPGDRPTVPPEIDTDSISDSETTNDFLPPDETLAPIPSETESESLPETEEDRREHLPLDGEAYVLGDPDSSVSGAVQYVLFQENHRYYENHAFILYGRYVTWNEIACLSFGEGMNLRVRLADGVPAPEEGSFVKMWAVCSLFTSDGDANLPSVSMAVSAVEVLQAPETDETILYVSAEALTVRADPDSRSSPVGMLYKGDAVLVQAVSCGDNGEWCRISFDCEAGYGYVKTVYLTEIFPS